MIELGAGTAIPTVRLTSESVSEELRANFIRINPREFDVAAGCLGIASGALAGIIQLEESL